MPIEVTSVDLQPPGDLLGRNIELPRAGTLIDGEAVTIVGWAIGRDSPIVAVEAVAHDEAVVSVPVDRARPDLAVAFPDAPGAETGGFTFTVALGAMPSLALTLNAVDEDGRKIAVGSVDARRRWPAADSASGPALVSVVVTSLDQADDLAGALESIARQTYPHLEVAVVDAGSSDNVARVVAQTPGAELVRIDEPNVAAARNAGFTATTGSLVLFLDAADRLVPDAVETALRELADHPEAAFVSGRARVVGNAPDAAMLPQQPYVPSGHYAQLLQQNYILNHGAVVYRRPVLTDVGLFDVELPDSDYDAYLRIASRYPVTCHTDVVVEDHTYVRRRPANADLLDRKPSRAPLVGRLRGLLRDAEPKQWPPPIGAVDLGDLTSVEPLDPNFGYARGTPIDRYYIERFLERHAADVAGRVLEVQENDYTMRFGGSRVAQSDVLHLVAGNPRATIVGDLVDPATLPEAAFDCVILTQTLHLVTDPPAALRSIARALIPGGTLLLTTPGITRVEWGESWYWSFTSLSLRKLLLDAFGPAHLELESHGNVHAATGFLHGLAVEETEQGRLDHVDLSYPVVLTARVRRR
jgi:glycosyltransferase involved in cell wall biosynthesis